MAQQKSVQLNWQPAAWLSQWASQWHSQWHSWLRQWPAWQQFSLALVLSLGAYGFLLVVYGNPHAHPSRTLNELILWPTLLALLAGYGLGWHALGKTQQPQRFVLPVVLLALACAGLCLFTWPFHSTDLFGYINRGWQQVHYGLNPYVYTVDAIPDWHHDRMITNHWIDNPCPYGFTFAHVARFLCDLGHGRFYPTVWLFKGFNVLVWAATGGLLWWGLKRYQPELGFSGRLQSLYLFLWSPLILIQQIMNGHNDLLMGMGSLFSVVLLASGTWLSWLLPLVVLGVATLVKYSSGVLGPFMLLLIVRRDGLPKALLAVLFAVCVCSLISLPYSLDWPLFKSAAMQQNAFVGHGSPQAMLVSLYKFLTPFRETKTAFKHALNLVFLAGYGVFMLRLFGQAFRQAVLPKTNFTPLQAIRLGLLAQGVLVCLISSKFYPWYLGMFFPLALLLPPNDWLRRAILVLSISQLFALTVIGQAHILNVLLLTLLPLAGVYIMMAKCKTSPLII